MTSINTQLIETLKSQYEALESKIQEIKNSNKLFSPYDFFVGYDDRDRRFDLSDVLTESLNHEYINSFPDIKQKFHELESLLLKEQEKINLISLELLSLSKEQENLVKQLRSLFKELYLVEFNKAYISENNLKPEIQIFTEQFKDCKSYKKYEDKFVIVLESKISRDEIVEIIKNNYSNFNHNIKGTISIEKAHITFYNYQNFI